MVDVALPGRGTMFVRGCTRRCAVCGSGGLFRRWFRMVERCPRCGLQLRREEGSWSGDVGMNTIVSFGLLFVVLLVGALTGVPIPVLAGVAAFVALVVPVLFHPFSKTLWLAIDVMMRPPAEDELDPAWVAAARDERAGAHRS